MELLFIEAGILYAAHWSNIIQSRNAIENNQAF